MESLIAMASALGLATASGLNAYLPLLTVGLLSRLGLIQLSSPFDLLSHPVALIILATLAILDFVGDKVPALDSALHAAGMVISPVAGAIVALAAAGGPVEIHPALVALAGVIVAGGTQGARATIRPAVTLATGGTANPLLSLAEDGLALLLSVLAILVPVVALGLAILLAIIAYRLIRGAVRVWRGAGS